jgi:hypothetical protein
MKHLKSINEYQRTVGFRYSAPKESYNIDILCKGDDITKDKINLGLSKVSELVYNPESIEVKILEEGTVAELADGAVEIDAVVRFSITVYNEKEIFAIVDELGHKLSAAFNIDILDYKSKENLAV